MFLENIVRASLRNSGLRIAITINELKVLVMTNFLVLKSNL